MIEVSNLTKTYLTSVKTPVEVLKGITVSIRPGELVAVTGSSGSGKSTFLTLVSGLDEPTSGSVAIDGHTLGDMGENELTRFRAKNIGFVFQRFQLLPHFSALENVALPLDILKVPDSMKRAEAALESVGLASRKKHLPEQMSGGECQRVAIARALATEPKIIFADEPTGNLDNDTAETVTDIFFKLVSEQNVTMVIVTHNQELAKRCSRHLTLSHGKLS